MFPTNVMQRLIIEHTCIQLNSIVFHSIAFYNAVLLSTMTYLKSNSVMIVKINPSPDKITPIMEITSRASLASSL